MAIPWIVGYDDALIDEERQVLEGRRELFTGAYMTSIFWTVVTDSKNRRYVRALSYSDRTRCLGQFILSDIQKIADEEQFKGRLIAGEYPCSDLP